MNFKEKKEKCKNSLLYGGVTKQEFMDIAKEVEEKNRKTLSITSFCLFILFGGLSIASFFAKLMAINRVAYVSVWLGFGLVLVLTQVMKKKGSRFVMLLWYFAMTIALVYAVVLNTVINNRISATTFCVIMITAPILVIDRPWRIFSYFSMVVVIFIFFDFHQKEYYLAYTDTVNALCCIFVGSAIQLLVMQIKLREILHKRQIEKERDTDKLTGCLTKAAFERKMTKRIDQQGNVGTLLVMDLDHFKSVNDNYGHIFGDLVLRTMGNYIQEVFRENSLSGRFGGDEFQVWIPELTNTKEISALLEQLIEKVHGIQTPDQQVKLGTSIGVAVFPKDGKKYLQLFQNADAALYTAKVMGRDRYVFCPEIS